MEQQQQQRKRRPHRHRQRRQSAPAGEAGLLMDSCEPHLLDAASDGSDSDDSGTKRSFRIVRPVYTQQQFDDKHGGRLVRRPLLSRLRESASSADCSAAAVRAAVMQLLPCISIMRSYSLRQFLLPDIIAGLTVGIMHIPQGMAYAFLAELPPYIGLYTSFFPPLLYFFFGTSRQISMGTLAIVSLLVGGLMTKSFPSDVGQLVANVSVNGSDAAWQQQQQLSPVVQNRVALACATCFCVGVIQLLMGVLRLGFLTRYLSDPLISGFTMGVAVHVFSSQLKYVLGVDVPRRNGPFSLPLHYYDLVTNLHQVNFVTISIAAVAIVILFVTKEFINPKVKKKIKAPLPMELLIVTTGTILSYSLQLEANFKVKVVGKIPTGIPPPEVPDLSILKPSMAVEIITIAVIAFSVCVSLAKIFGKKYNYEVVPSQELIAYGICNTVGSFFHCWPAGSSLSRSAVQDSMGGKTQLAALFSSALLLLVLLFVGKYFETVPNCCLSAIILVAIKGMLEQVKEAPKLWRLSPYDFWTWTMTCLGVVLLSVDLGLLLGLVISVCTIIVRTQAPTSSILGRIPDTDLYKNMHAYEDIEEIPGVKIFRFEGSLYFACAENFRESLYHKSGVNPRRLLQARQHVADKFVKSSARKPAETEKQARSRFKQMLEIEKEEALLAIGLQWPKSPIHHVILDASTWGYMDYVGLRALSQTIREYQDIGLTVFLANPKCGIRACLHRSDFYENNAQDLIYVSVHDAVLAALCEQRPANRMQVEQSGNSGTENGNEVTVCIESTPLNEAKS